MRTRHLDGDELDRLLAGEDLPAADREHLESCVACRRRRDAILQAVQEIRLGDPAEGVLDGVRDAAMAAFSQRPSGHGSFLRWALAAAAAVILAVLATFTALPSRQPEINAAAVLAEVDEMLASDPLDLVAPEEVVDVVLASADPQENAS